jgi:hypothetical protein
MTYPIPHNPAWDVLDTSKLLDYIGCPRRYFYRHMLGWISDKPNNHLVFGEAWHRALEVLLQRGYEAEAVTDAFEVFMQCYRPEFPEDTDEQFHPKTPAVALQALLEYCTRYNRDAQDFQLLNTEVSGCAPLSQDLSIYFRLDAICRSNSNGKYFVLEHKTAGNPYMWAERWLLSLQVGTYTHVLYCLFKPEEVFGVVMNGTFFQKRRTNPIDFLRFECPRTEEQMRVWLFSVLSQANRIQYDLDLLRQCSEDDAILGAFPLNPENCTSYGKLCPYHDYCVAWPNPLRRCHEPQPGFKVEFWDPRNHGPKTNVIDLSNQKQSEA